MLSSDASGSPVPGIPGGAETARPASAAAQPAQPASPGSAASASPAPAATGSPAAAAGSQKTGKTFDELFAELTEKWRGRASGSGTVAALEQGIHHIGKKLVEEAAETWMAAEHESRERAAEELSQLLYWSQLVMISLGLSLDDVYSRL